MKPSPRRPLHVEALEDRAVPAKGIDLTHEHAADHIIVRFKPEAALALPVGAHSLGSAGLYTVPIPSNSSVKDAIDHWTSSGAILYAEPDYIVHPDVTSPNDTSYADGTLWGMNNTGQSGGTADADIDAPEAWDIRHDAPDVVVAVIDTGVDYTHPDLAANIWTNPGEVAGDNIDNDRNGYIDDIHGFDFFDQDSDPIDTVASTVGHGTHVSGTIAGVGNNGVGVVGVAWSAQVMALRFLGAGGGSTSGAIEAINYAVNNGAKLSNNSWGGGGFSFALQDAIANANKHGHLFVAAAGNGATNNDIGPHYPSNYELPNVISVAALDRNDNLAGFSEWGALTVDLGAPGVAIFSTNPTSITASGYRFLDGTSMATPHVTGALTLLIAEHPTWKAAQLKEHLLGTTVPVPSLAGKTVTGGRLNLQNLLGPPGPPRVIALTPVGSTKGDLAHIRVKFNNPIDPKTFNAKSIKVTGPDGTNLPVKVKAIGVTKRDWDISFKAQKLGGSAGVRVFIASTVNGPGGALNQDGDGTPGELGQDHYIGQAFQFAGTGGIITDPGTTLFPISVGSTFTVRDVNVQVNLDHPYDGDLRLELIAPNAAVIPLFLNQGLNGDGLKGTWFDDQAGVRLSSGAAPFAATFQPETGLAPFNGLAANGTWTLRVTDVAAGANGILNNWQLGLATDTAHAAPTVTGVQFRMVDGAWPEGFQVDFSAPILASSFTTKDVKVTGPGNRAVKVKAVLSAGGASNTRFYIQTDPILKPGAFKITIGPAVADTWGASLDGNANLILAEKTDAFSQTLTATELVFRSTKSVPLADSPIAGFDPLGTLTATLNVKSKATIAKLRLGIDITHTWDSDLRITLKSPIGTSIQMINQRGSNGDNFTRTILDDAAAVAIGSGTAPFIGSYRPEFPLSGFIGEKAAGKWQLIIEDGYFGDTGNLVAWAIYVTPAAAAPPARARSISGRTSNLVGAGEAILGKPETQVSYLPSYILDGQTPIAIDVDPNAQLPRPIEIKVGPVRGLPSLPRLAPPGLDDVE